MARVPRNKGSYHVFKDGRVQVKFPLGYDEEKGRYAVYSENLGSEAEAIAAIKDINDYLYHGGTLDGIAVHRLKRELPREQGSITFREFADRFVADREKQGTVAERTIEDYRCHLKRINPYLGDMSVSSIRPRDVDELYSGLRGSDPRNGSAKPIGGTYLQHIHSTLSLILGRAVAYELLPSNPCDAVSKPRRDTEEKEALSADEARALVQAVWSSGLDAKKVGLIVCMCTAARLSEMLALTWRDFDGETLTIGKSMVRDSQRQKQTKTHDRREDPCPTFLVEMLDEWMGMQRRWFEDRGLEWSRDVPIVNSRKGTHTLKSVYEKWFRQNRAGLGLPDDFTIHGLRHTAASVLQRDCGADIATTMGITGHKTMEMLKRYSHTNLGAKKEAMGRLDSLIAPDAVEDRCRGCASWAPCPDDPRIGACWRGGRCGSVPVTRGSDRCSLDSFWAC